MICPAVFRLCAFASWPRFFYSTSHPKIDKGFFSNGQQLSFDYYKQQMLQHRIIKALEDNSSCRCWCTCSFNSIPLIILILCSLNWQHQLCKNPRPNPDIKTLFMDHTCSPPNGPLAPTPVNLPVAKPAPYAPLGAHSVWCYIFLSLDTSEY